MKTLGIAMVKAARIYSMPPVQHAAYVWSHIGPPPAIDWEQAPKTGDMVVEMSTPSTMDRAQDCIGIVLSVPDGKPPLAGSVDGIRVMPLFPSDGASEHRWENCSFRIVPEQFAAVVREAHRKIVELARSLDKSLEHLEHHAAEYQHSVKPEDRAALQLASADVYYPEA